MAKRAVKKAAPSILADALSHIEIASRGTADYAKNCQFNTGWLIGYDGIVAAGHKIADDYQCAPDLDMLKQAVKRVGSPYSLALYANGSLAVAGERLRSVIPCLPMDRMPHVMPDAPMLACTREFRDALVVCGQIAVEKAERVALASVRVRGASAVATNGSQVIEQWHGLDIRTDMQIPKEFLTAIEKVPHEPTAIGWRENSSVTIWFGPDRWARTQLYEPNFPDTDKLFAEVGTISLFRMPTLLDAMTSLTHRANGTLWCAPGQLSTEKDDNGATFLMDHPFGTCKLSFSGMMTAAHHAEVFGYFSRGVYWQGAKARGVFSAIT